MDNETAGKTRGMIRRVVIKNRNDGGATQTVSAQIADNIWHDDVEILQPFGFATAVPEDGAVGIALAVGGDEGDMVILPISNPSKRYGELIEGEAAMYSGGGDFIKLSPDGTLEINIGGAATFEIPGNLTINAPLVTFKGDVKIDGRLDAAGGMASKGEVEDRTGTMQKMRDQHNEHGHPQAPSPPIQKMD